MTSVVFPTEEQVLRDLGDELLQRLVRAVDGGRDDYHRYCQEHPDWAADETARTSANFIHDRIWSRLRSLLDDADGVVFVDKEPERQFSVGSRYVFRVKRHRDGDCVSSYPTAAARAFWSDEAPSFEGLDVHNLALGYRWDADERAFGEVVLSYRTAMDSPLWVVELRRADEAGAPTTWAPVQGPTLPTADLSAVLPEPAADEGAGS